MANPPSVLEMALQRTKEQPACHWLIFSERSKQECLPRFCPRRSERRRYWNEREWAATGFHDRCTGCHDRATQILKLSATPFFPRHPFSPPFFPPPFFPRLWSNSWYDG